MGRDAAAFGTTTRRRGRVAAVVLAATLGLAACGSSAHFEDVAKPSTPVDLTVYIDNTHVAISPNRVGAGPVLLFITNEASNSQTLSIENATGAKVATTHSIDSGQTAQISADLRHTGSYQVLTGSGLPAAGLKITGARPNATRSLLAP